MVSFDFDWPWIGIAFALPLLALLFFSRVFCASGNLSRWYDPAWLAVLGLPLYVAHQFEEHGIDVLGVSYAFRGWLCDMMAFPDAETCPIPLSFITSVNVGSVWGASVIASVMGRHKPAIALSAYGIPLVNAFSHIAGAIKEQAYNPGLLTAVLLFLPASLWALSIGKRNGLGWKDLAAIAAGGLLVHAVLMGSLIAFIHGAIGAPVLVVIQVLNMSASLIAVLVVHRIGNRSSNIS